MLPAWAYPCPRLVAAAILLAHLLDLLCPYSRGLLLRVHPVHTAYLLARRLAPPHSGRLRGVAAAATVLASHLAVYSLLLYVAWLASPLAWLVVASWVLRESFSLRLLLETAWKAAVLAERGAWREARIVTQGLVRRNVFRLSDGHVMSAAVESLFESLVDGYTSPLFYATLLGPLGALAQRLINTLDSALGYPTPEYRDAGWAAARLDDLVNLAPARLTALLATLLAPLAGGSIRATLATWRRHHRATKSPNAGHPIAAAAGALRVKLEKPGHYTIGQGPLPTPSDTKRAVKLATLTATTWTTTTLAILTLLPTH